VRENKQSTELLQGAISVFILFHLIAILCWTVPTNVFLVMDARELVSPYMQWTGLVQSWDTFAPNPKSVNEYIKAVVITQDRHMRVWTFPRMEQLSLNERYRKERYRKFAENLVVANNAVLLPDVARRLARMYKSPGDPPDEVLLVQFSTPITPPVTQSVTHSTGKDSAPRPVVFYEDYVEPTDLQ
jgi:hypothetical protein